MAVTLRSLVDPNQVTLTPIGTTPEQDALTGAIARENEIGDLTAFGRANLRGQYQTPAMLSNALGQVVEPFSQTAAQPMFDWASQQQAQAQQYSLPTDVTDIDQVKSLSDAGNFAVNMVGENLAQIPLTVVGGLAGNIGLRAAAISPFAKSLAGASVAGFPLSMGENVGTMRADPVAMQNTTPTERLLNTGSAAAIQAPLDAVGDALLMGRAMGAGKIMSNVFKDGIGKTAKDSVKHVAKAVPEAAISEGLPESAQEFVKQQMMSNVNPDRDTSKDTHELANSFFAGWAAGGPMSAVGRGSDVAWAQGRGATDAIKGLFEKKTLPDDMRGADDSTIVDWDKKDDAQRNSWAKDLADSIMESGEDVVDYVKDGAKQFYERAAAGAKDAWTSMADVVERNDTYRRGKEGVEDFIEAVRRTNKSVFGGETETPSVAVGSANARGTKLGATGTDPINFTPVEKKMYDAFNSHLDRRSDTARNTELKANLYKSISAALKSGNWQDTPWHKLQDEFETPEKAIAAVAQLRDNLVRSGELDDLENFKTLLEASFHDGLKGEQAKRDVLFKFGKSYIGKDQKKSQSELRDGVRAVTSMLADYPNMTAQQQKQFDTLMKSEFGKNAEHVIEALAPKSLPKEMLSEDEVSDMTTGDHDKGITAGGQIVSEDDQFYGSSVVTKRRNAAEGKNTTVKDHGGMWNLGHGDEKTRESIKTAYYKQMQALRQQGATVEELAPLQYAQRSGNSAKKIAANLGIYVKTEEEAIEKLRDHPARMILVTKNGQVGLPREGNEEMTTDEITTLSETTAKRQRPFQSQFVPQDKQTDVRRAFGMTAKGQTGARLKLLRELGFPNAVKLQETPRGLKVINNMDHSDEGRFEVHMKDGSVHVISAQDAIQYIRTKGRKDAMGGNPLQSFNSIVAQIMANPDVVDIKVRDIFGREVKGEKFGGRFRLMPGVTIKDALRMQNAPRSALNKPDKVSEAETIVAMFEERLEDLEQELAAVDEGSPEADEIKNDIAAIEAALDEAQDNMQMEIDTEEALSGDGQRQAMPGGTTALRQSVDNEGNAVTREVRVDSTLPEAYRDKYGMPLDQKNEKPLDFNDDGSPKHPVGAKPSSIKPAPVDIKGVNVQKIRAGVGEENLTPGMRKTLMKIEQARGIVKARAATLNVAQDYVYRAAAAQKAGNQKARNALLLMADHHLYSAMANESDTLVSDNQSAETTAEIERLNKAAAQYYPREVEFQQNKDKVIADATGYTVFNPPKTKAEKTAFQADPDRWSHRDHFLASLESRTDEELIADGVARKARIERMSNVANPTAKQKQLLAMMQAENTMARAELRRRKTEHKNPSTQNAESKKAEGYPSTFKDGHVDRDKTTLRREIEAKEKGMKLDAESADLNDDEQTELDASIVEARKNAHERRQKNGVELDKLASELAKGNEAAHKAARHLSAAFKKLVEAINEGVKTGKNDGKGEIVAELREAWKNFKQVIQHLGNVSDELIARGTKIVQQAIAEYQRYVTQVKAFAKDKLASEPVVGKANSANSATTESAEFKRRVAEKHYKYRGIAAAQTTPLASIETKRKLAELGVNARFVDDWYWPAAKALLDVIREDYPSVKIDDVFMLDNNTPYHAAVVPLTDSLLLSHDLVFQAGNGTLSDASVAAMHHEIVHLMDTAALDDKGTILASHYNQRLSSHFVQGLGYVPHGDLAKEASRVGRSFFNEGLFAYPTLSQRNLVHVNNYSSEIVAQAVAYYKTNPEFLKKLSPKLYDFGKEVSDAMSTGDQSKVFAAISGLPYSLGNNSAPFADSVKPRPYSEMFKGKDTHAKATVRSGTVKDWVNAVTGLDEFIDRSADITQEIKDLLKSVPAMLEKEGTGLALKAVAKKLGKSSLDFVKALGRVLERIIHARVYVPGFSSTAGAAEWAAAIYWVLGSGNAKPSSKTMGTTRKVASAFFETAKSLLISAQNELIDSKNATFEKIGRMFSNETGAKDKDISLVSARIMKANQMTARYADIMKDLDEAEEKTLLMHMQDKTAAPTGKLADAQKRLYKFFDDMHEYGKKADVDMPKADKYFPRAWDSTKIAAKKKEFVALLVKDSKGSMTTSEAETVANNIIRNRGAEPLSEGDMRVGYTPYMNALNKRKLDFLKSPEFAEFQQKDMTNIVTTYIHQLSHRAEYARRFGNNGEKLRKMLKVAVSEEVGKNAWDIAEQKAEKAFKVLEYQLQQKHGKKLHEIAKDLAAAGYPNGEVDIAHIQKYLHGKAAQDFAKFEKQLHRATRAIMAMEGTLGYDINENMRRWQAGIIVYENMRLLTMSLFSQVIDPLGVLVRGGTMKEALNTFTRGLKGTVAGWRGKPIQDEMTRLARKLGLIDASNTLNSQGQMYTGLFMGEQAKKWNDRLFRWNGVEGFSEQTRVGAMEAAISFIKSHAHGASRNQHSDRWLSELGLDKNDVVLKSGELDYANPKIQEAIFRWVDSAILRPNAALRPSWASDPHYAIIFHMKQFTYAFHKVLLERVAHEYKNGNYDPMMNMMLTYVPAMIAADILRGFVSYGGEPPWKKGWGVDDYLAEGVQRAGLLGIPQIAVDVAKWGPTELGGPFVEHVDKVRKNYYNAYKRDVRLDAKAAESGKKSDQDKADEFDWTEAATKRNIRLSLPAGEIFKRATFDQIVDK